MEWCQRNGSDPAGSALCALAAAAPRRFTAQTASMGSSGTQTHASRAGPHTASMGSSISLAGAASQVELRQPQSYENRTHHGNILKRGFSEHLLWNRAYKQQAEESVRQLHRMAGQFHVGRNVNRSRAAVCSALIDCCSQVEVCCRVTHAGKGAGAGQQQVLQICLAAQLVLDAVLCSPTYCRHLSADSD